MTFQTRKSRYGTGAQNYDYFVWAASCDWINMYVSDANQALLTMFGYGAD